MRRWASFIPSCAAESVRSGEHSFGGCANAAARIAVPFVHSTLALTYGASTTLRERNIIRREEEREREIRETDMKNENKINISFSISLYIFFAAVVVVFDGAHSSCLLRCYHILLLLLLGLLLRQDTFVRPIRTMFSLVSRALSVCIDLGHR